MEKIAQKPQNQAELIKFTRYINEMLKGFLSDDETKKHPLEVKPGVSLAQIESAIADSAVKAKSFGLFSTSDHRPKRLTLIDRELIMVAENVSVLDKEFGDYMNQNYTPMSGDKLKELLRRADKIKTAAVIELRENQMVVNSFNGQYGEAFFSLLREEMSGRELIVPGDFGLLGY